MNPTAPLWLRTTSWLAVAAWVSVITLFSSLTGSQIQDLGVTFWDKAEHFLAFWGGGLVLAAALRWNFDWPWLRLAVVGIIALSLFGAVDEIHQLWTPGRSGADPLDWLADTLGAIAGVSTFLAVHARLTRTPRPAPARN